MPAYGNPPFDDTGWISKQLLHSQKKKRLRDHFPQAFLLCARPFGPVAATRSIVQARREPPAQAAVRTPDLLRTSLPFLRIVRSRHAQPETSPGGVVCDVRNNHHNRTRKNSARTETGSAAACYSTQYGTPYRSNLHEVLCSICLSLLSVIVFNYRGMQ